MCWTELKMSFKVCKQPKLWSGSLIIDVAAKPVEQPLILSQQSACFILPLGSLLITFFTVNVFNVWFYFEKNKTGRILKKSHINDLMQPLRRVAKSFARDDETWRLHPDCFIFKVCKQMKAPLNKFYQQLIFTDPV